MSRPHNLLLQWFCWTVIFFALSYVLGAYETIMNHVGNLTVNQVLFTGAPYGPSTTAFNLWNEGVIGYCLLAGIGVACFMWCRDFLRFKNCVCSLGHSDILGEGVNT